MIKVKLTSTTGSTKEMHFDTKESVIKFVDQYGEVLPIGTSVCIDAPLVGIYSGWIRGKKLVNA